MIRPALVAVLLAVPAIASAEPPAPGIYSNVTLSEESGDLGGAELELIGTGADARVEFVLCEGWCNEILRAPVTFTPDGFGFSYTPHWFDENGEPVAGPTYHAEVERKGSGVTITITQTDTPDSFFGYVLRPIEQRFGLDVAAAED